MDVYKVESCEILRRFLNRRIGQAQCLAELDSVLHDAIMRLKGDIRPIQKTIRANSEVIAKEMRRRDPLKIH